MESPTDKGIGMDENMDTGQQQIRVKPSYETYPIQCSSNGNTEGGESYHVPRSALLVKLKELVTEGTMPYCKLLPQIGNSYFLREYLANLCYMLQKF